MGLFTDLHRREVWKTMALYVVGAWIVIQGADLLFAGWCIAESAIRHVWIAALLGIPVALVFSWCFDISKAGLQRTVLTGNEVQGRPLVKTDYALLLTLSVVAIGIVVIQGQSVLASRDCGLLAGLDNIDAPDNSIAVLPFAGLGEDTNEDWLGTAFSDSIRDSLGKLPGVIVTSRQSSLNPQLKGLSAREAAALLGVAFILEGSVQRQGDRLRITPQIVSAKDDSQFWSSRIDRNYSDLFDIQDEVAEAAASALQVVLSDEIRQRIDREGTENLAAFEEYSRALENLRVRTFDSVSKAAEQLQRAIELDPEYARAHALLGHVYLSVRYGFSSDLDNRELADRARDSAKAALEIAPGMSMALTVLGRVTDDVDAKGELYREAVAKGPNDELALQTYAIYLDGIKQQLDEPMALAERLIELDPLNEKHHWLLAHLQLLQVEIPTALKTIERGKQKVPDSIELRDLEAFCHFEVGNYADAIVAKYETLAIDPKEFINRWSIATFYLLVEMPDEAGLWFARATETAPEKFRSDMDLMHRTMLDVYYLRNDEEVFAAFHRWPPASFGLEKRGIYEIFIEYGVRLDRLDEVLAKFKEDYPDLFTVPPTHTPKDGIALYGVTLALLRHGDTTRAEPLVGAVLDWINTFKEAGYYTSPFIANVLLAQGKTEEALESFKEYVANNKYFISGNGAQFLYRNSSLYDPIRGEPEFIGLLEEYDRNAAEQRELLQGMDLPIK